MRRTATALFLALLAGCASDKTVLEGDRKFEARDFDAAAEAYGKAAADSPGDAALAAKLDAARKNAATAHAERAAQAAEAGDLDGALAEIGMSRKRDPGNARYGADEKKYGDLRAEVAAQLVKAKAAADPEVAHRILTSVSRYGATFPEIGIRLAQAGDRYVRRLLAAAEDLGKAGEWLKSQIALEHAAEISAKDPQLSDLVKTTRTNVRVLELLDQGYRLKAQGDVEAALARFTTAQQLRPDAAEAIAAVKSTRRALAETLVAAARDARDAEDPIGAYAWLARAEATDPEAAGAEEISALVREDAARALVLKATDAGKRGLTGLEWLRLAEARAIRPEDPAIDRAWRDVSAKIDKAMRPVILVKSFRNATRQGGREVRLAAETYRLLQQQAANGKLATILDEDAYAIFLKENPGFTPDIIVKGTLERFDLIHHPDRHTPEFRTYDKRVTYLDITGSKYVDGIEQRTYYYTITEKSATGVAELSYEIYDVGNRTPMSADMVKGDLRREDRVVAGNKEAGVAEDADEMPADETLQDELQTQLKDKLLLRIRTDLDWVGKRYYTAYERARESGTIDVAISWAVIAMRSLQAAGRPALAEDNEFVLKRTGWSLSENKLVPEHLK